MARGPGITLAAIVLAVLSAVASAVELSDRQVVETLTTDAPRDVSSVATHNPAPPAPMILMLMATTHENDAPAHGRGQCLNHQPV